ncbi:MAG: lanthionine synthetase LanC family protein [Pseudomonadota bacterium]
MSYSDQLFHQPETAYRPGTDYSSLVQPRLPRRWRLHTGPVWTQAVGPIPNRRTQGWKIHLSSTLEDAARALEVVSGIAPAHRAEFKFASDVTRHLRLLSKNVGRQTGGKFITIYPRSDESFSELLEDLHGACRELRGPYILSDSPYKDSPVLFYRYGGFQNFSEVNVFLERKSLVLDESYRFVEDRRLPNFVVPPFAALPAFDGDGAKAPTEIRSGSVDPAADDGSYAAGAAVRETDSAAEPVLLNGRYQMLGALKQSNIGGVYLAKDCRTGDQVVLREARPHTDPDIHGQDAVLRLRREYEILQSLEGLDIGPRAIDFFQEWHHSFLVCSHEPGRSLRQLIVSQGATLHSQSSAEELGTWFRLAHEVAVDLIEKVRALHARGIVYGDVSTNNIIIEPASGRCRLIDFETAFRTGFDKGHNAFTPGYAFSERLHRGVAEMRDDVVGAGAVMLAMLCPSACNLPLVDRLADLVLGSLESDFGLDPDYSAAARRLLEGHEEALEDALALLRNSGGAAAHVMPQAPQPDEREALDALLGDTAAFLQSQVRLDDPARPFALDPGHEDSLLAFDHGLSGIAYALCRLGMSTGADVARHVYQSMRFGAETPGLLNGLAGGAWACLEAEHWEAARDLLARCDEHRLLYADYSLGYGLAGIGLASLKLWLRTGDEEAQRRAARICTVLLEDAVRVGDTAHWPSCPDDKDPALRIGLHGGAAGIAKFLVYAHCALGDAECLQTARDALRHDLQFSKTIGASIGFPKVAADREAGILYPYMEVGTAGMVHAALRLYRVTGDASLARFVHDALPTVAQRYTVCAGVGPGLAGLADCLLDAAELLGIQAGVDLAWRTAGALRHFRVAVERGAGMPARLGGTVSGTYVDGTAGVALLLDRLVHRRPGFHFCLDEVLPATAPVSPTASLAGTATEPPR